MDRDRDGEGEDREEKNIKVFWSKMDWIMSWYGMAEGSVSHIISIVLYDNHEDEGKWEEKNLRI